ncbi:MAG: selenoprotein [Nannocystis sp.]|nr:selenoprotein [Nannocystis sp.]
MVAELTNRFGDETRCTLIKGDRGVFDVKVDGHLVFSKSETGRFPMLGEVADEITALLP